MSRAAVARAAGLSGYYLAPIEAQQQVPTLRVAEQLALALGTSLVATVSEAPTLVTAAPP